MDAMDGQKHDFTKKASPQPKPTTKPRARRAPRASRAKKPRGSSEEIMAPVHGHPPRPTSTTATAGTTHGHPTSPSSTTATNGSAHANLKEQKQQQPTKQELLAQRTETLDPKTLRADQLLDIVTLTHNDIHRPPVSKMRIYDHLCMQAYIFHNEKTLLILPPNSDLYVPIQTSWDATALPSASPRTINDQILTTLLKTTGLHRGEIVEGWPSHSQKSLDSYSEKGVLTSYRWIVSCSYEIRLGVVPCPEIEPRGVRGWCWASDKEVYMLDRSGLVDHDDARLVIDAFKVKKERERQYLGLFGLQGS